MTNQEAAAAILAKVQEIARSVGRDARKLKTGDNIPDSGVLDSAGLMELLLWYEAEFDLTIPQDDYTVENLGSVDLMVTYAAQSKKAV